MSRELERWLMTIALLSFLAALYLLAGCAQPAPRPPAEVPKEYVAYEVEKPVPCFKESERPRLPPLTPINFETSTPRQRAAALAADTANAKLFTDRVDELFTRCQAKGV